MKHLKIRKPLPHKQLLILFALLFSPSLVIAQKAKFQFFSNANEISCGFINDIHQDKEGFVWVLGEGSDRYDGYNFVPANGNENELPLFDGKGRFKATSKNVIRLTDNYLFFQTLDDWKVDSISFRNLLPAHAFFLDPFVHELMDGAVVFPYMDSLSNEFNFLKFKEGKLERLWSTSVATSTAPFDFIQFIFDNEACVYVTDEKVKKLLKYDSTGQLIKRIAYPKTKEHGFVFEIDKSNNLWMIANNELFKFDEKIQGFRLHAVTEEIAGKHKINDLVIDKAGNLWVICDDRHLLFYDEKENEVYDYYDDLSELIPRRVDLGQGMLDRTGVLWIKTVLGIVKVVPQDELFDTYFDRKTDECQGFCSFRGIAEGDNGEIYGAYYNGLFRINRTTKTSEKPFPNFIHTPKDLHWKDGRLMLNNGQIFDPKTALIDTTIKSLLWYSMDVGEIEVDAAGNYWNAQSGNAYILNEKKNPPVWEVGFDMSETKSFHKFYFGKESNKFWVGDANRLFVYDFEDKIYRKQTEFQKRIQILDIYEDKDESLWLGTDSGLIHYDPKSGDEQHYTTFEGLSHNYVCGILPEGDSCLWLSTNEGLSRITKETGQFLNFYEEDGLANNEFNRSSAYLAKDGQLFFGGMQGIVAFYPEEVLKAYQRQKNKGKIMLSAFSRTDEREDVILTDLLDLNQKQLECFPENKSITFEFSLSDYRYSAKNKYSYYLEGYEEKWSEPSRYNFARYPILPPGDYVFKVKTLDAKGHWNPNELSVPLKVYPPWWQTTTAYVIYFLFVIILLYMGYLLLRNRLDLQNQFRFEQNEARRLKELDVFKSRLFTNITHEFRTPLTVILGMTEELQNGFQAIESDQKEAFTQQTALIQRNGKSLLRLVNQLLDLSKLEHKSFKLKLENNNSIAFLNYVTSSFNSYANQQNILLNFNSSVAALYMDFDSELLQQVMTNLLSNAIKFTPSGGEVSVYISQAQNQLLTIEVRDTGIGIPISKLENIFDIFYQVDGSITRSGEGTGIGLAHTKELVELARGTITARSEEGKGSSFLVQLPIQNQLEKSEKQVTQISSEVPLDEKPLVRNNSLKANETVAEKTDRPLLLLIEDNPDVLTYLKSCLDDNYQIEIALNGRSGIEKALSIIPDLIISDVMMPEKDGFEVCAFLKQEETTSHIPIVLLTAKADVHSKLTGLKRGADAYFSKPFRREELLVRVAKLLERQTQMALYFKAKYQQTDHLPIAASTFEDGTIEVEDIFLQKVNLVLEQNYTDKDFTLLLLCKELSLSRSQLFRKLKALTGESPSVYIKNYRLQKAKHLLETTEFNVSEVAWKTGFASLAHFSRSFQQAFGFAPSATSKSL